MCCLPEEVLATCDGKLGGATVNYYSRQAVSEKQWASMQWVNILDAPRSVSLDALNFYAPRAGH